MCFASCICKQASEAAVLSVLISLRQRVRNEALMYILMQFSLNLLCNQFSKSADSNIVHVFCIVGYTLAMDEKKKVIVVQVPNLKTKYQSSLASLQVYQ